MLTRKHIRRLRLLAAIMGAGVVFGPLSCVMAFTNPVGAAAAVANAAINGGTVQPFSSLVNFLVGFIR